MTPSSENRRILIIDDNLAIHDDFRKILATPSGNASLLEAGANLFGPQSDTLPSIPFELSCANQGQTGLGMVQEAIEQERPFAVAFVDMRMPPGWDGVETIERIWEVDPDIQIVICPAFITSTAVCSFPIPVRKIIGCSRPAWCISCNISSPVLAPN